MSHPLESTIAALRLRVRGLVIAYGLGWSLGLGGAALIVFGATDYVLRFQDPGIRVLASLAVAVCWGWAAFRFLVRMWMVPLGDVELARRVQKRFPALGDDLASAVEFLRQPAEDLAAGSASLRQAVVARATAKTQRLSVGEVLRWRPVWRAASFASLVALAGLGLAAADRQSCAIALARLVHPLAEIPWPQVHHLTIQNRVDRVARGQPFEVAVVDAAGTHLPAQVRIHYRLNDADGAVTQETQSMRPISRMMVARRESVMRPFAFRVEGGDDHSMPWQDVAVVEPPAIESLVVSLVPPAYTGWPPEQSNGSVRALAGTRAEIAATASKPLASAALVVNDKTSWPAKISQSGRRLVAGAEPSPGWILEKSGFYALRLTDQEGFAGSEEARWGVDVVADAPPNVSIEEPNADLFLVPRAVVPLGVSAEDDLAIRRIDLEFVRSDRANSPPQSVALYAGPARVSPGPGLAAPARPFDRRTVQYVWKLEELRLAPGVQVTFQAVAADYKPQSTKSPPRRLWIITPDELAERIASRQAAILGELSRVLEMQRRGHEQVSALERRAGQVPRLGQVDVDQLRGVELNQRQVEQSLARRGDGVPLHVLGLLADLKRNGVDEADVRRQWEELLAEIQRIAEGELPAIERELTAAVKTAQAILEGPQAPQSKPPSPVRRPIAAAAKHQNAVIAALARLVDRLGRADRFRRFHHDVSQLADRQAALERRTAELAGRTLTKELKDLSEQEASQLAGVARQQAEIAGQLDALQQSMDQAANASGPTDPSALRALADGLRHARQRDVLGQMRAAGDCLGRNQLGQAMNCQQRIEEDLRDMLDILSGRSPRLPSAEDSVAGAGPAQDIRRMQEEVNRRTQELEKTFGPNDKAGIEARGQYEALGRRQDRLAEMLQGLSAAPPPETQRPPTNEVPAKTPNQLAAPPSEAIDRELFAPEPKEAKPPTPTAERKGVPTPAEVALRMREAAGRIRQSDGGPVTQELQGRILAELDELLRHLGQDSTAGKPKPASAAGQKTAEGQKTAQGPERQGIRGENRSSTRPGSKPEPGLAESGRNPAPSGRSDRASRTSMLRRLWGDLPQRERETMLQLQPPEEFLPKYELLIEEYFKRLAEDSGERKVESGKPRAESREP